MNIEDQIETLRLFLSSLDEQDNGSVEVAARLNRWAAAQAGYDVDDDYVEDDSQYMEWF